MERSGVENAVSYAKGWPEVGGVSGRRRVDDKCLKFRACRSFFVAFVVIVPGSQTCNEEMA